MAIYTLYACRADGSSETFAALDLGSHKDARREAEHLLSHHQSCVRVVVWLGDRKITTVERQAVRA